MSDCISIHAPPRGATWKPCKSRSNHLFQFTPLREGRRKAQSATAWHPYFNSRPSARGDVCGKYSDNSITISIHAPPRGATSNPRIAPNPAYFNSRPSARGDPLQPSSLLSSTNFNSRPSARGDKRRQEQRRKQEFQFTPLREGRPDEQPPRAATTTISIHAPPRGAT